MRKRILKIVNLMANKVFPAFMLTCGVASSVAQAAPQGGVIVGGQGSIATNGNVTNINQNTGAMVVDWSSFNVQQSETVNFNQPSSSAAALNRIYDQNPSQIFGSLNANGRVFLSNPNGIIFGQTATVNVGALFATGLRISNDDFMSGNYRFTSDGKDPGAIINRGLLQAASGGSISLVGGQVINEGLIIADYGQINLATGRQAVLNFDGDGLISFKVSEDVLSAVSDDDSAIRNSGRLQANGGTVLLDAHVAHDVFTNAINNEGVITAHRIADVGGEVYLMGNAGTTRHGGVIDAYGESGDGGTVVLLGEHIDLDSQQDVVAVIDASGDNNGGTILVGGDYQGTGDLMTAETTTVADDVQIEANAANGQGGKVILWSDDTTVFHGQINARSDGGEADGGFAEVSGKQHLLVSGHADLTSVNGDAGTLLLDPGSVDIVDGANTAPPVAMDTFNDGWINAQLGTSSVIIDTNNSTNAGTEDITVDSAAIITWANTNSLSLQADNHVVVDGQINATGSGTINLTADADGLGDGTITVSSTGDLATVGGTINLVADEVTLNSSSTTDAGAGNVNITSSILGQEIRINSGANSARLDLSAAELQTITANTLSIGSTTHTGVIDVNQNTTLSTVTTVALLNDGNVTINNDLTNSAVSGVIQINADAGANGGTGSITAGTGDVLTADSVSLTAASSMGTLANNVLTAANTVSFNNTTSNNVFLHNTGNVSVSGSNSGRDVSITSTGTIVQNAIINAATLTTSSVGNTTLNLANTLTAFNASSTSGGIISIVDSAGGLDITGITSAAGVNITTTGNLTQSGIISGSTLTTVSNSGNTTLGGANTVSAYNGTTNTSGDITFNDNAGGLDITGIGSAGNATLSTTGDLTQSGVISAGTLSTSSTTGSTTLNSTNTVTAYNGTTTGANQALSFIDNSGGLDITGVSATGDATLSTTGNLTQSGAITADILTTTSTSGSTTLNAANVIDGYNGTSTGGSNAISITDSVGGLNITGINSAGNADITTTGALTQSVGVINASTLTTVSNSGSTTLNSANTIANFNGTSNTSGNVNITSANALDITGITSAGDASITTTGDLTQSGVISSGTLTTVSNSGNTTLNAANTVTNFNGTTNTSGDIAFTDSAGGLNITGLNSAGNANITTTGALTQSVGVINASTLTTVSNSGSTTLNSANTISNFNGTSNTSGDISITSVNALDITGISSAGDAAVTTTGDLTQSGAISAATLTTASNSGNTTLNAANTVTNYNGTTNTSGDIAFTDSAGGLDITGINSAGDAAITTTGALTQSVGVINAATLTTVSNSGSTTLNSANTVTNYNGTTNTSGDIAFTDSAGGLNINGISSAGNATITTTGNLTQSGGITANTLTTVSNSGNTTLNGANVLNNYNGTSNVSGNIAITDSTGDLNVTGINSAGSVDVATSNLLTVGGVINASGDVNLTADNMAINNAINAGINHVSLQSTTAGNLIDLGSTTNLAPNTLELSNAELNNITAASLTVGDAAAGNISITDTLFTALPTANVRLVTNGSVDDGASGLLQGATNVAITANGNVVLDNAGHDLGTVAFSSATGDVSFTDTSGLTVGSVAVDGANFTGVSGNNIALTADSGDVVISQAVNATGTIDVSALADEALLTISATVTGTNAAHNYIADNMAITGAINATGQRVTLNTAGVSDAIDLGLVGDATLNTLELSQAELQSITADTLTIGKATAGLINNSAIVDLFGSVNTLHLITNTGITAGLLDGLFGIDLAIESNGTVNIARSSVGTLAANITGEGADFTYNDTGDFIVGSVDGVTGITTAASTTSGVSTGDITLSSNAGASHITISENIVTGTAIVADIGATAAQSGSISITAGGTGNILGTGQLITGDATVTAGNAGDTAQAGNIILSANEISSDGSNALAVQTGSVSSGGTDTAGTLSATTDGSGASGEIRITSIADLALAAIDTADGDTTTVDINVTGVDNGLTVAGALALDQDDVILTADRIDIQAAIGGTGLGTILIQPNDAAETIGVGNASSGGFNLDSTELAMLDNSFNSITIGQAGGTGAIDITGHTFVDPITIQGGAITVTGLNGVGQDVTLISTSTISDGANDQLVDIATTGTLTLVAQGAIGTAATDGELDLAVNTVQATTSSGGIYLRDDNTLTIGATGVSTTGGNADIDIKVGVNDLILDGAITADGSGNINLLVENAVSALITDSAGEDITSTSGDITISSGLFTHNGGVIDTSGDISITTDTVTLSGSTISGAGNLTIQTLTAGTTVGIGNAATGSFNIDNTELGQIQDGFASVSLGAADSGAVDINGATFTDNTIISGGDITVDVINAAANALTLNSSSRIIQQSGSAGVVTAGTLNLNTTGTGNTFAIGDSTDPLAVSLSTVVNADSSASGSIHLTSTADLIIGAIVAATNSEVSLHSDMGILDGNGATNNITALTATLDAVTGIGAVDMIEVDVANLSVNNTGAGNIDVVDANSVTLTNVMNDDGDITIIANNDLTLAAGLVATTTTGGDINLLAGNNLTGAGAFTVTSANGFSFNKSLNTAGSVDITTVDPLNITENITTSAGSITFNAPDINYSAGVVLTAANALNINASSTGAGDLSLNANGIDLLNALTVNNGSLTLNAGNDDLSIVNAVTVNNGNVSIVAADLDIQATGSLVGSDTVTISDSGNGMELGGTPDPAKLNISLNEYERITASALLLSTQNTLTLKDTFQVNTSISPLTINANQMNVTQAGTVFGLKGNLDLQNTTVVAAADLALNVEGAFSMNDTLTTNGVFKLNAGQGITMGEAASITSNNNQIDMVTSGGDILLGLADAGTANVNLTASAGSILNNNGVFADVTQSVTNIKANSTTLTANQRIGASSTDAITIDASPAGLITLDFNAEKAFINNLQNTRIVNNGSGDVAVGLIFSGQIIGVGHNVGLNSQQTEEVPADQKDEDSMMSVIGADHKLAAVEEEEEDSSTLNTVVPVMIRTKEGWEFKAPLKTPKNKGGTERKVDWL